VLNSQAALDQPINPPVLQNKYYTRGKRKGREKATEEAVRRNRRGEMKQHF